MTAAEMKNEMALRPFRSYGPYVITYDGHHWIWDRRFEQWTLWK